MQDVPCEACHRLCSPLIVPALCPKCRRLRRQRVQRRSSVRNPLANVDRGVIGLDHLAMLQERADRGEPLFPEPRERIFDRRLAVTGGMTCHSY